MSKITDKVTDLAKPVVEEAGCTLWDVEYVKEAGSYYLRIFIDKDGGVTIDDCEAVSRALDPILDEADPIPDSYIFEVGSPGAERELKRPSDFQSFLGNEIEIRLFHPVDGRKNVIGILSGYDNGDIFVTVGEEELHFNKSDVSKVKLHVSF